MTQNMQACAWIALEWRASQSHFWGMSEAGEVLFQDDLKEGVRGLNLDTVIHFLKEQLGDAPKGLPVIVSGWRDASLESVPCKVPPLQKENAWAGDGFEVHLLQGIQQGRPADMMRGGETRIAGFVAQDPEFDGILCLPGQSTTWAHISAEEIVSFRTCMTGALFAMISEQSELSGAVATSDWDQAAFEAGLSDIMSRPADFSTSLLTIRAEVMLQGLKPEQARARLLALLIGSELSAARPYWLGQEVVIFGSGPLADAYEVAMKAQGVWLRRSDATEALLAGFKHAYAGLIKPEAGSD